MDSDWTKPEARAALLKALATVAVAGRSVDALLTPAAAEVAPLLERFGNPEDPPHARAALVLEALDYALASLSSAIPDGPSKQFDDWKKREQLLDMVYRRKQPWTEIEGIMLRRTALKEERAGRPWTIETLHSDPDIKSIQREEKPAHDAVLRIMMTQTEDAASLQTHVSVKGAVRCVTGAMAHEDYRDETHASPGDVVQLSFIVLAADSGREAIGVTVEVAVDKRPSDHHHVSAEVRAANQGHAPGVVVASDVIVNASTDELLALGNPRHFRYQTNEDASGGSYEWSMPTYLPLRLIDGIATDIALGLTIRPTITGRVQPGVAHAVKLTFLLDVESTRT